jgi:hypothetical protein
MLAHDTGDLCEDRESELRKEAPPPCRDCRRYQARESLFRARPIQVCGAVDKHAPNGQVVSGLMLRIAALAGDCPEREGLVASA